MIKFDQNFQILSNWLDWINLIKFDQTNLFNFIDLIYWFDKNYWYDQNDWFYQDDWFDHKRLQTQLSWSNQYLKTCFVRFQLKHYFHGWLGREAGWNENKAQFNCYYNRLLKMSLAKGVNKQVELNANILGCTKNTKFWYWLALPLRPRKI